MRAIFLIHLKQVIRDKDWVYPVFLLLCTLLGQSIAPTEDDPDPDLFHTDPGDLAGAPRPVQSFARQPACGPVVEISHRLK